MRKICVVGAGRIGEAIGDLLLASGDYAVELVDHDPGVLERIPPREHLRTQRADVTDPLSLDRVLKGADATVSALPWQLTLPLAEAAARAKVAYFDLTEDVATTRAVGELAASADSAFMPQCGLAPGFVSVVAHDLVSRFDEAETALLRVGALPRFPTNRLGYNLTWSPEGVVNEYCEPCPAIVDGERRMIAPLGDLATLRIDGVSYEAFNTSGGVGSLTDSLAGRIRELRYQSLRYPGHADAMKLLLDDLGLRDRREQLIALLRDAIPETRQDVVVIHVSVRGRRRGALEQEAFVTRVHGATIGGVERSAIQLVTAGGVCAMIDLMFEGALARRGLLRQEQVPLSAFLANRFGRVFAGREAGRAGTERGAA